MRADDLRIAVIPKGTTHEFWKSVHAGAVKAAGEAGVDIVWKGPLKEDDLKSQIDLVQSFVAQGVSGIVLAPLSDTALRGPVKAAGAVKIPVVVFDSDLQGDEHASFVATDNDAAGKMAGEAMAQLLGDKGSVVVLRYQGRLREHGAPRTRLPRRDEGPPRNHRRELRTSTAARRPRARSRPARASSPRKEADSGGVREVFTRRTSRPLSGCSTLALRKARS